MTQEDIFQQLTNIFRDLFEDDTIVLTNTTNQSDIAEWDSMSHVNLMVMVESHFDIKFRTAEIEDMKNVGDLVASIAQKMAARNR